MEDKNKVFQGLRHLFQLLRVPPKKVLFFNYILGEFIYDHISLIFVSTQIFELFSHFIILSAVFLIKIVESFFSPNVSQF